MQLLAAWGSFVRHIRSVLGRLASRVAAQRIGFGRSQLKPAYNAITRLEKETRVFIILPVLQIHLYHITIVYLEL